MTPAPFFAPRIEIFTSEFVGELVTPTVPLNLASRKGPYKLRTIKRWRKRNQPYYRANGTVLTIGPNRIVCHPGDYAKVLQAVRSALNNQVSQ